MTYAISDIHGRFDKYSAMLEKINFGEDDMLYVLGDIIDRYDEGLKILLDMINRPNIRIIMGNHEAMMLDTLLGFEQINESSIEKMALWVLNGGEPTLTAFLKTERNDRIDILSYLEKMSFYAEISVGENDFVLLHGGLEGFSPERPLDSYSRDEIVWAEPDFERGYFTDKFTIIGHTPTETVCGEHKIFRKEKLVDIDCGIAFESDKLGCLRLEDFCEFYV